MIEVYQGNTLRINLTFTNDDGTPLNLSGYNLYFIAKRNYSESTGSAPINILVTGHDTPVSGITHVDLTTGDTSICANDYLADITLIASGNSSISSYRTDGLRILPGTFYSP